MEKELNIQAVIGFKGSVNGGLILHPDNEHLIFSLGSTIVVRQVLNRQQSFLRGHDNNITVIKVSKSGKFIASGQQTFMGFQADIIVWDFASRSLLYRLKLHKVLIESLTFSKNELYLSSLGGVEDKNTIIVWDLNTGKSLYGSPLGLHKTVHTLKYFKNSDEKLIAILADGVQIITIDKANKKIKSLDVNFGNIKRIFTCGIIDQNDEYVYCGTTTGDVLEIHIEKAIFKRLGPYNKLFSLGVTSIGQLPNGDLIIGAGDGSLNKLSIQDMKIKSRSNVMGKITSMTFTNDYCHFFCGTGLSNLYWVDTENLTPELRNTCHYDKINDVAFPIGFSDVFATCSLSEIRIWNSKNRQELLRIDVPNLECNCIAFNYDGKSILSGWNDGKIRAFYPQSGKIMFVINDAHLHGVTSLALTSDSNRVVSGGSEGEVRVFRLGKQSQQMEASMKEHRGRVWSIQITKNNDQAVSASSDGSCIVWDIKSFTRIICLFESTLFKQVIYHPDESQLLTTGSNKKITYWATFDGQAIRMLDGAEEGDINTLAITRNGEYFVSGGGDKQVKLWGYDDGMQYFSGLGHSSAIQKVAISPNQQFIVSVGQEGAIFLWEMPQDIQQTQQQLPVIQQTQTAQNQEKSQKSVGKTKKVK